MKEVQVRQFSGWTASELWRILWEDLDWENEEVYEVHLAHRIHGWHPAGLDQNQPNGRPDWDMEWFDTWGDEPLNLPLTHAEWTYIDALQTTGMIDWGGPIGETFPTDATDATESRIFDWISIGEFQNELHYEGLPDYEQIAREWKPSLGINSPPHWPSLEEACRSGFTTHEGWEHITDADRREIWRISEKIISDEGGGRWVDNNEKVGESPEPDFSSPDDPDYTPGARTYHTGIRLTLTKEEWAFIDALSLSTAQDWEDSRIGAPDNLTSQAQEVNS